jgi:hypothetical protein
VEDFEKSFSESSREDFKKKQYRHTKKNTHNIQTLTEMGSGDRVCHSGGIAVV